MDIKQLSNFKNIAVRINDLPYHEDFLHSEKLKIVLYSKAFDPNWGKLSSNILINVDKLYYSEFNFDLYSATLSGINNLIEIQRFVFNQYNLYHVLDRNEFFNTNQLPEQDLIINQFIVKSLCLLIENKIDLLIIHDTPHSPHNFILFECAKGLGISILNIRQSPIPWGAMIEVGLGRYAVLLNALPSAEEPSNLMELVNNYTISLCGSYAKAIPEYERIRQVKYKGNLWSWRKELRRLIKYRFSINYIRKSTQKYRTLRLLITKSSQLISEQERYVVFYLHYQPERTTLPEGDIFNQQLLAIQCLRTILPNDVKLVVREHPSTYRNKFVKKFRPDTFYNSIAAMKGVVLSSPLQSPFDLLDKSLFIGTITGTVGIEAVIRGKCCVYFGNATYKDMPGAYHIDEVWHNRDLLQNIVSGVIQPNATQIESYFKRLVCHTVNTHSYRSSFVDYNAHLKNATEALLTVLKC